jgi:hypothetical protein
MASQNSTDSRAGWPPGFFIGTREHIPTVAQITAYRGRPVATIGDCLGRSLGATGLKAYHEPLSLTMCGPALTVRVRPGDNLMIHKALELARAGDVLVIDGGGDLSQAVIGGLMRTTALAAQLSGIVLDGALRDVVEWGDDRLPVFAKGHTHRGPSKNGPGEVNRADRVRRNDGIARRSRYGRCRWRDCCSDRAAGCFVTTRPRARTTRSKDPRSERKPPIRSRALQCDPARPWLSGLSDTPI